MPAQITKLANGLRIVTDEMPHVETVSMGIWVHAGTRNENPEHNGVAHFLEHMAFKGTKKRSALAIAEEIEAVGGHLNAYTSREVTAYYAKVLRQNVALAVDVLTDILQNSVFDANELERERGVILQEIGQNEDTPDELVYDYFQEAAYPDQAMGRSILGPAEIIQTMPREAFLDFINQNYVFERMVFAAAGNIKHDEIVAMVKDALTAFPAEKARPHEAARYAGAARIENKKLEQVHFMLGFESLPYGDPDYYNQTVLSTLLGGGMSSRLFQEIREKRGLVYSVYSFNAAHTDTALFSIYAGTGEKEIAELCPVLCDELLKIQQEPIRAEELERARTQLKAGMLMALESTSARCERIASQSLIYGAPLLIEDIVAKIDAVTIESLQKTAQRIFASKPTLAAIGPLKNMMAHDDIIAKLAA